MPTSDRIQPATTAPDAADPGRAGGPARMDAWVPTGRADPPVRRARVPAPIPGPHELVVAVEAFSVNRGETFLLRRPRPGWRPGQDVAGRVATPAANGGGPPAGARVVAHAAQGGWAPLVAVDADAVTRLPDDVTATAAATLPVAGITSLRLLRCAGPLADRRVLLTGASGGVGHVVVELAAAQGAEVSVVSASRERGERLLALGARELVHDVRDAEGPFDVVLECVGGTTLNHALERLAPGGTLVWFGQAGQEPSTLDFFAVVGASPGARIVAFSYWDAPGSVSADLGTLVGLVREGRLHPEVGLVDDWRRTDDVLAAVRDRRVRGNGVLTIGAS